MTARKPTYEELEAKLGEVEDVIGALRHHEVDAIVGETDVAVVHLREVEAALHKAKQDLEERVVERTAELAQVSRQLREIIENQRQTQRKLEESERKYRELVESANSIILRQDTEGRITFFNEYAQKFLGYGEQEILGHSVVGTIIPPANSAGGDQAALVEEIGRHPERHPTSETESVCRKGRRVWISWTHKPIRDESGRLIEILSVGNDITEQKQAQQQLEQYTAWLHDQAELLDLAHDMIFVHDMDGRIAFWNRGAELAYGWKREEALGRLSHELLRTEFSVPSIRLTAQIIRDGWWEGELVHTTRDGRKVTVATRWALRKHPDGRPVAILEIDNDITARKRAEQEMREARQFAESIVNTIGESLVVLDPQGRIVSANRSFHETFGTTPPQVEGRPLQTLANGPWADAELGAKLNDVLAHHSRFEGFEVECGGAEPRAFVLSAQPIRQPAHDGEMVLLVIQDITLRKGQEREIQADKEQLESLAEELMMVEERQRRQIAQALHDSIGQSLAFSKRELNLLRQRGPQEIRATLQEVGGQLDDAIKQTRDLICELSPSTLYSLGLQPALEELAEQFAEAEGFHCRVQGLPEGIALNEQMRSLLYRAVRELLVNVAKHAEARNVEVILGRDESHMEITVQDDGKGFDPSVLNGHGTEVGFGILSVRERLLRVGGKFSLQSQEGQGTRVTMIIPLEVGQRSDWGV